MSDDDSMTTLLVGLDAACAPVLDPLFENERLPHLRSIVEEGASGPLESQIPPWTASAWPSLFTGTNPGKHGVFGFLAFEGYDWDVVNATDVREHALWELLDTRGKSSVVVNVPVTHPPRPFSGALLPGYTAPEEPACHPEGLLDDVREAIGDYRIYPPHEGAADVDTDTKIAEYRDLVGMRGAAFRYLIERFAPDFGFVQFQATDTVFHECEGDRRAVRAVYEAVDEEVGEVLDSCDPDTVIVASDHGIGEYGGYGFRANTFLDEQGYLTTQSGGEGMPTWVTARDTRLKTGETATATGTGTGTETDAEPAGPTPVERAIVLAARAGLTTQRITKVLETFGLLDVALRYLPQGIGRAGTEQVDFPASRAYVRDAIELGVRLNVAGREPAGVVPEAEYETVREDLIDRLSGLETPDGDPLFETVGPREDFFHGLESHRAVDIVTVPAGFEHSLSTHLGSPAFDEPSEPYDHKRNGIVAARGGAVDSDADLDGAHLFDVAPTVLATLGVPAGERMDGRVLPITESVGETAYPDLDAGERAATDDAAVERRLSDLGYIE
jgi:predicted AlkP superfamily phosphohydrolase/phosphomutase